MKRWISALALAATALGLTTPAGAHVSHHYARHASVHHSYGLSTGRQGYSIHSPMRADSRPDGASVHCRDGSWSFSQHHRGTCSHHGGVASW